MKKLLATVALLLVLKDLAWSFESFGVPKLRQLESATVYSVVQDSIGAVWFNTNYGVYRFNGVCLDLIHSPLPMHKMISHANSIVTPSSRSLCCFDIITRESMEIPLRDRNLANAPLVSLGGELFLALSDSLYKVSGDSLSIYATIPSENITALESVGENLIVCGTSAGNCYMTRDGTVQKKVSLRSGVNTFFVDSKGRIWTGLRSGRVCCLDPYLNEIIWSAESCRGKLFSDARTFSENESGDVYFGTATGLFRVDKDFSVSECPVAGKTGQPVCSVLFDKDWNLWIGTYYCGVSCSYRALDMLTPFSLPDDMRLIKGVVRDGAGRLWVATDNFGLFVCDGGIWSKIPGTDDIKYQNLYYDPVGNRLLTSEYMGPMIVYNLSGQGIGSHRFYFSKSIDEAVSIVSIALQGGTCYLATSNGLFCFDPGAENEIVRQVSGIKGRLSDVKVSSDGIIWTCGTGIYKVENGNGGIYGRMWEKASVISQKFVSKLAIGYDGSLWAATIGDGCYHFKADETTHYCTENIGLVSNYVSSVCSVKDSMLVIGTRSGLSIYSAEAHYCKNFPDPCGARQNGVIGGNVTELSDGSLIFYGSDCMALIGGPFRFEKLRPDLRIDVISVNGKRKAFPCGDNGLKLEYFENNFSLDVCTFDYAGVDKVSYFCKIQGLKDEWREFDVNEPLTFMNMRPGHYDMLIRGCAPGGEKLCETFFRLRIKPVWYSSIPAFIIYILAFIAAILYVSYSIRTRINLSRRLEDERLEKEKRTKFFVELSCRIRTPLNIMIGQMERFFKDYGSRTAGIESIEDIFSKARQVRMLVSDYVDEQDVSNSGDARFLNAATGAVERNLFKKITVKTLCDELNVCKTGLTERLERVSGKTPRQFIEDIRLEHAAQMLLDGNMMVSEISDRLMFSNPKYFTKRFKLKYGAAPSYYASKFHKSN